MNRTHNVARNIVWGLANKLIAILLPFLARTAMIYTMGTLYLGLNSLFASILQVLNISELGISSAISFSMYKPLAEKIEDEVCSLLNFYKKCYRIIGFVVLVLGLLLLPFLRYLISGEIPADINLYILYFMFLGSTVFSYELFAYRTSLLIATQRNDIVSKIGSICNLFQFTVQMVILFTMKNYYLYTMCVFLSTIANNVAAAIICRKMYPQYLCKGILSAETFRSIRKKVSGMIFQKIGGVVLSSVDTIVISAFLGLNTLAVYQNYYYVITALFMILQVLMNSLIATVGNSIAIDSAAKNYGDFRKLNFIYLWCVSWCSICLLCLYQPFMEIWVGKTLMLPFRMVILFAAYFFIHKWCDMLYVYQEACGIWWETKWVPITAAILNLTVNLILVKRIGLAGILISTIVSFILVYNTGYARVLFKVYFKENGSLKQYAVRQLYYLSSTLIAAVPTIVVCHTLPFKSAVLQFLSYAVICLILPNVILLLLWHTLGEFKEAKKLIENIVKKKLHAEGGKT